MRQPALIKAHKEEVVAATRSSLFLVVQATGLH